MWYNRKGQESPVNRHNCGFLPLIFSNLGHLECYTPLNCMCFWSFLLKAFYFSKSALHVGTIQDTLLIILYSETFHPTSSSIHPFENIHEVHHKAPAAELIFGTATSTLPLVIFYIGRDTLFCSQIY